MTKVTTLKVLDLSINHLTPETREMLDDRHFNEWPCIGGHMPYGYFIYVFDADVRPDGVPDDLWTCMEYAYKHGCSHMWFDCDAAGYDDLPFYGDD